jgi:hypothetical protein
MLTALLTASKQQAYKMLYNHNHNHSYIHKRKKKIPPFLYNTAR